MVTTFFNGLIDDFGIWQHTNGMNPVLKEGYALDDATRGLILCLLTADHVRADVLFNYIKASFADGTLYGFATAERVFITAPASEDATAQVIWAMSLAVTKGFRADEGRAIIANTQRLMPRYEYVRGSAYALLGAIALDHDWAEALARDILERFEAADPSWPWPEEFLTYGNAIVPYALIRYGAACGSTPALKRGLSTLTFLDKACRLNHYLGPVGNDGWYSRHHDAPPIFAQQPIDSAYMVWACQAAHEATKTKKWRRLAEEWMSWFEGNNVALARMYEPNTGKCYDGIDGGPARASSNSGAESNICLLLSQLALDSGQLP